jgi:hypothetical protein
MPYADRVPRGGLVHQAPLQEGLQAFDVALDKYAASWLTNSVIDDHLKTRIGWVDDEGTMRQATMPRVVFVRSSTAGVNIDTEEGTPR